MKINGIEERRLINRLIDGDQTAFELLFRFYYPGLLVFAKQLIFDPTEAENIVQDFFVNLWVNRAKIKDSSSLKGYFFTSIKNRAFNYLKRVKVREHIIEELKQLTESDSLFQPDVFIESELQNKIKTALNKLPRRTREIFVLSRTNGLTNDEIAEKLNISKRTVETQISNALKVLRIDLKDYLFLLLILGVDLF
ncbi:MAG: RNA polymerase sigma-70 factor [Chlorobi bacterium]|nr:RNA polymerase sigma-70 factor [Chlorobiota bacterium]